MMSVKNVPNNINKNRVPKRILILNTHPDDETLSYGGLMSRAKRKGQEVYVHTFAVGGPCSNVPTEVRLKELEDVMKFFNCNYSYDEGFDGILATVPNTEITSKIDRLIDDFEPEEVYCSALSEHSDHIALYNAFEASARLRSGFMPKLFAVGVYQFSDQLYPSPKGGKIFQPLTDEDFDNKCKAFRFHKSQFKPKPSPLGIEGIRVKAEYDGMACGHKYAELYYQLRYVRCI